ncbi:MAG: ribonuclease Y [Chloroflexi bacterium]|nr:ribonuclease Y [Chloroflexota bacterium]
MAEMLYMLIGYVIVFAVAGALGYLAFLFRANARLRMAEENAKSLLEEAKTKEKEIILAAKDEAIGIRNEVEAENRERRIDLQRQERRIQQKEENLDRKIEALERRERNLVLKEKEHDQIRQDLEQLKVQQLTELERISELTTEEAKAQILRNVEADTRQDAARKIREIEAQTREEADRRAREILAQSIQRCASDCVAETTVSAVPLPSDDMKGRIIGREGRNIRALEQATGIDLIVDDTPEAVTLSGFDPVRREVARRALTKLILDGRIHPARIEEVVNKAKQEVDANIKEEGEKAAYDANVQGLHPDLIRLLGRLKYRTSYGQNVLAHSLETSFLAAAMAAEIGADINIAKTAGLLHDIGKAVDHEVDGPHAQIGADIAKRLGRSARIVHAIAAHHGEEEPQTVEAFLVGAADAISGARPGARRESVENYIKRLEALETVASSFAGVDKTFAIQAGREVRIMVRPDDVDDLASIQLARDIVKKIEESLEYPGQIKVTVIRETRAVEYAK